MPVLLSTQAQGIFCHISQRFRFLSANRLNISENKTKESFKFILASVPVFLFFEHILIWRWYSISAIVTKFSNTFWNDDGLKP